MRGIGNVRKVRCHMEAVENPLARLATGYDSTWKLKMVAGPSVPAFLRGFCEGRESEMLAPSGFGRVSTTKPNSTRSIAAHPCKKRKDGAPSVGIVRARIVRKTLRREGMEMKSLAKLTTAAIMLGAVGALAQQPKVYVESVSLGDSGRNQSMEMVKDLQQYCPEVINTLNVDDAD
jgi:hypothetical protein